MKKFAEKHNLVKISGIMVLITVLLTWVIPQGYFSNGEMSIGDITRVGLFDFFTYGLLGMYYFTVLVTLIFVLGGFYQVLSKIDAYQRMTTKLAEKLKGKEVLISLLVTFIIGALTAITNEFIVMLVVAPFIVTVMRKMGLDKLTAFLSSFGAVLIGMIGSVYCSKIAGINVSYLSTEYSTLLWAKILIFAIAYIAYSVFTIIHIEKTNVTNENKIEDLFEEKEAASNKKTHVWPLVVVLALFVVVSILAYLPWEDVFGVEIFKKATESITSFKVLGSTVFGYILGSVQAFGKWDIFGIQILMVISTLLLKVIYKIDFSEFLAAYGEGFKKVGKLVVLLLICYMTLEFSVMYPILPTVAEWIMTLTSKFNVFLGTLTGVVTSLFTVEYQYTASLVGQYMISEFKDFAEQISLMLQSTYGLASFFAPTSVILMLGLSYLGISYKEWMKHIWKFLVIMLVAIVVIMFIICK